MPEYFMGQELIQGELPENSPRPAETPPEGVIMTDTRPDGASRRYIYIAMAGEMPEEITISETQGRKQRVSGAARPAEEYEPPPVMGIPEGIEIPEHAVLPENAVFSGLPSGRAEAPAAPFLAARSSAPPIGQAVMLAGGSPRQQVQDVRSSIRMGGAMPAPAAPVSTVSLQKAAAPASVSVQQVQAPLPGGQVNMPVHQAPTPPPQEMSGNIRLSNSIEAVKPVVAAPIADAGQRMAAPVLERQSPMLGQISRPLPLTVQETRKPDTYPVNNPVNQAVPVGSGVGPVGGPSSFAQNQVPLRQLGQAAPAAAPASSAPAEQTTGGKCPGAVEMPDGRVIEPGDKVSLQDLCELVPFLVESLTNMQAKGLAPGQKVPVVGQKGAGATAVPTSASFGPAGGPNGQGPYAHTGGGFIASGGGGPGPAGPPGPAGTVGPPGPGSIVEPPVVKTDGDFTAGAGAFVPVPGTSLSFSMLASGVARFDLLATLGSSSGVTGTPQSAQIGLRVDGTDYPLTTRLLHTFAAGVGEFLLGQSAVFALSLGSGSHTVEVILRGLTPGEFGGAGLGIPAVVAAVPAVPLILTVSHSQ